MRDIEREQIPAARRFGMGLLPYFPLASGLLTGKYRRGEAPAPGTRFSVWTRFVTRYGTEANFDRIERLEAFARERGHTLLELAFSWLLAREPVASVIAGATKPEQIIANAAAASWALTAEELAEIDALLQEPSPAA